jgi:hypothetical protein
MSKKQILALFVCGLVPWTVTHVHHWDMPDCRCDRSIGSYPFWYARGWSGCTSREQPCLSVFCQQTTAAGILARGRTLTIPTHRLS